MSRTVDIPATVKDALKEFRFSKSKGNAAISVKIVKATLSMAVDEEFEDQSIEEIAEELPENAPRYILLSHELARADVYRPTRTDACPTPFCWSTGKSTDACLNLGAADLSCRSPSGSPVELLTLHASALSYFQQVAEVAKVLEVRDGAEGLTKEAVDEKLLQA
ncbi:Actin-depolymerizing factor gmf1 [Vanrija pseudolonga]|uniref:Actin-depolymerizing factor gmf1 n=1 Tax=Vanrija pseudolonga TaxID=143232 RepID=A0AAF0Y7N5_9TREE|nr:Actin-depolymerizing factor gmf1 [Vanrija pseudolonga]